MVDSRSGKPFEVIETRDLQRDNKIVVSTRRGNRGTCPISMHRTTRSFCSVSCALERAYDRLEHCNDFRRISNDNVKVCDFVIGAHHYVLGGGLPDPTIDGCRKMGTLSWSTRLTVGYHGKLLFLYYLSMTRTSSIYTTLHVSRLASHDTCVSGFCGCAHRRHSWLQTSPKSNTSKA